MVRPARFLIALAPALVVPLTARGDCAGVPGADALLVPGRVVMLGEMHGTQESPAFVADLVCRAVEEGLAVRVGLEIAVEERPALAAFLDSAGSEADREALLSTPFWTRPYQDGRSSRAMAALLASLRALRAAGGAVTVFPFSHENAGAGRDAAMARTIAEAVDRDEKALTLTLSGNLHSRTGPGSPWDPGFEPMGYLLARERPDLDLVSLDVRYAGGEAWICTGAEVSSCGARPLGGTLAESATCAVALAPEAAEGHDGSYCVGTLHASPPAAF
ncbi:MAG: hypothetical protein R2991_11155 [Thermoanaerobaculia bacterium]